MEGLLQFPKLWQQLEDCIENKRFRRIEKELADDEGGRCINGVFLCYAGWKNASSKGIGEGLIFDLADILVKHYNVTFISEEQGEMEKRGRVQLEKEFYDIHEREKKVSLNHLASMNNIGVSFEDMLVMLKKIDA